jgi:hypothetical protein
MLIGFIKLRIVQVVGSCEHGNELEFHKGNGISSSSMASQGLWSKNYCLFELRTLLVSARTRVWIRHRFRVNHDFQPSIRTPQSREPNGISRIQISADRCQDNTSNEINQVTNSMELSPSLKANSSSATKKISQCYIEPEGSLTCSQKSDISCHLSQINLVHTTHSYFSKINFNITLLTTSRSS